MLIHCGWQIDAFFKYKLDQLVPKNETVHLLETSGGDDSQRIHSKRVNLPAFVMGLPSFYEDTLKS